VIRGRDYGNELVEQINGSELAPVDGNPRQLLRRAEKAGDVQEPIVADSVAADVYVVEVLVLLQ
jgi:hypothetical protein